MKYRWKWQDGRELSRYSRVDMRNVMIFRGDIVKYNG